MAQQHKTIGVCQISDGNGNPIASAAAVVPSAHVVGGSSIDSILSSVIQIARKTLKHLLADGESPELARYIICRDMDEINLIMQYRSQKQVEREKSASKLVRKISKN